MTGAPLVIVGGGPAGAAAALRLARTGEPVLLLERTQGPHDKVCGEFVSAEAVEELAHLGLDLPALGAVPITKVAISARGAPIEVPLPFRALSLSRRILDEALLRAAADAGAEVRRGVRVRSVRPAGAAMEVVLSDAPPLDASAVFLATGKHDLHGLRRPAGRQPDLVGFKIYLELSPEQHRGLQSAVELHLFPGGYAGLQRIEGGAANLCLLVRKMRLSQVGGDWDALLAAIRQACPSLDRRLTGGRFLLERPLAIAALPYGHVQSSGADGVWRLGDQAAVIPSFAGDGMAIALHSARRASEAYLAGADADVFQRTLARELRGQVGRATLLSQLMVRAPAQAPIAAIARAAPALVRWVASRTRVRPSPTTVDRGGEVATSPPRALA